MRRANDFYPTPSWAVDELRRHVEISGNILEPCAGDGAIAQALRGHGRRVFTADIDRRWDTTFGSMDARTASARSGNSEWVITNPPFNQAFEIVRNFVGQGVRCAFLLRLSFLEPTLDRGPWLAEHPPTGLIVLPRISFTGDGKTDSVTAAWVVWNVPPIGVRVVSKNQKTVAA